MARAEPDGDLEHLLLYLRDSRAFDFTGYKRASLSRRIHHRMQATRTETYNAYMELLEANPGEFAQLFDTILINVTGFMRDSEAWQYLDSEIIPAIVDSKGGDENIRVWSAGTASGQEAYSLAVLLVQALGDDRFRRAVKIYSTDVDEEALSQARQARYPTKDVVSAFGEARAQQFFELEGTSSVFRQDLRRSIIFGRHDLVQDPPISRIDLLVCRNTLMYFTTEMQRQMLSNFHFALAEQGYLFLGRSEAMVSQTGLFDVVNLKHRVFRRLGTSEPPRAPLADLRPLRVPQPASDGSNAMLRMAFEESPVAQLVVDSGGQLSVVNRRARALFGLGLDSAGRALKDLQVSYRPLEIRSLVDEVITTGRPMMVHDVEWTTPGGDQEFFEVALLPMSSDHGGGVMISYTQVGRYKSLRDELERSQRELESAYEELQSTVEELETTNEELQSTNEELETTNEELHSTNEELETMNEELESTNEELETANGELRDRGIALDQSNSFLESILGSLSSGVVVLTRDLTVRAWNHRAEDMWGLRSDEVEGSHFLNLDIGLPVDQLLGPIRAAMAGPSDSEDVVLQAVNRRGRAVQSTISITPLRDDKEVIGVILVIENDA
jgi:two-component system CheB/CheR fusion protein